MPQCSCRLALAATFVATTDLIADAPFGKPINCKTQLQTDMPLQFSSPRISVLVTFLSVVFLVASPVNAQTDSCESAVVPNSQPVNDVTTAFYGDCVDNQAKTGLVLWKRRGTTYGISCLQDGKYVGLKEVMNSGFVRNDSRCLQHLRLLPGACSKKGYRGQCNAPGEPEGVGFLYTENGSSVGGTISDHSIAGGMLKDGKLNGAAVRFTIRDCGMLGCTGGETIERGWFVDGAKQFECPPGGILGCFEKRDQLASEAARTEARRRQEDATYQSQLASTNPQSMYLAAGAYARDGDWSKAQTLYNRIISKFPSSNWAVKASDQLDAQRRSSDAAARQSDDADQRQRERQRDKDEASRSCYTRISACENSCPNIKYNPSSVVFACKERCRSLCTP